MKPTCHNRPPRGITAFGDAALAATTYGPSYAHEARNFRQTFGNDDLLLELQNALIAMSEGAV